MWAVLDPSLLGIPLRLRTEKNYLGTHADSLRVRSPRDRSFLRTLAPGRPLEGAQVFGRCWRGRARDERGRVRGALARGRAGELAALCSAWLAFCAGALGETTGRMRQVDVLLGGSRTKRALRTEVQLIGHA
jgi:hypothetical protein